MFVSKVARIIFNPALVAGMIIGGVFLFYRQMAYAVIAAAGGVFAALVHSLKQENLDARTKSGLESNVDDGTVEK